MSHLIPCYSATESSVECA